MSRNQTPTQTTAQKQTEILLDVFKKFEAAAGTKICDFRADFNMHDVFNLQSVNVLFLSPPSDHSVAIEFDPVVSESKCENHDSSPNAFQEQWADLLRFGRADTGFQALRQIAVRIVCEA